MQRSVSHTRRALSFISPHKKTLAAVMALVLMAAGLEAVEPLLMKYIVDRLGSGKAFAALATGVGGLLALGLSREAINGVSNWFSWKVRLAVNYSLLDTTIGRLQTLPLSYHRNQSVGAIMTKLDRGVNGFVGALAELAFNTFPALFYLVLSAIIMLKLDWRLSLIVLGFAPLPALIGMWAAREQTEREKTLMDKWADVFSRLNEVLSGIIAVKSFTAEDAEKSRFLSGVNSANGLVIKGVGTDTRIAAAKNLVTVIARAASIAAGGYLAVKGHITVGTLIAFLGYLGGVFGPVQGLTGVYQTVRKASVSMSLIYSILDEEDVIIDAGDATSIKSAMGEISFEEVRFSFHHAKPVLENVSIRIEPGEFVALVGPSGAGKTTIINLLQRFYDPTSGRITLDGHDLKNITQRSIRDNIGVVFQDATLFNDTVKNNIAYARPDAPFEDIEEAARAAGAHDFITKLPGGYDFTVGERGGRLSAGERQRIGIARALLKNPPVLVLDEATSALDAENESKVQAALATLLKRRTCGNGRGARTTIAIAHRLSTVTGADRILVLKDGGIIENGNHRQLMAKDGYYASLVRNQAGGLIGKE